MNPLQLTLAAATSALALSACGTTQEAVDTTSGAAGGRASGPVALTDDRGREITLDAPAERVVALEWSQAENLVTLGVMPVGVADPQGYADWDDAADLDNGVSDVGLRGEPNLDTIYGLEPDLILMEADGAEMPLIKEIERYVPVMVISGSDASDNLAKMRSNFELTALAVGRTDRAAEVLAGFDRSVADAKLRIADAGLAGERFVMADGWIQGSSVAIRMFAEGSLFSDLGEAVGLENAWTGEGDEMWGLAQTDVEGISELGDVHFFYNANKADVNVFTDGLPGNPIWDSRPFVQADQVHKIAEGTWTFGGPAASMQMIDEMVKALA